MDCTLIKHTNGEKSIRYGIDPVVNTEGIETYLYAPVPEEKIQEIKTSATDRVQTLLSQLF